MSGAGVAPGPRSGLDPAAPALPAPDAVALEHSRRVEAAVRARLAEGPLGFADFMRVALYEPGLGYYMAGASKFGPSGDFVTAPELGPLFGRALAVQCREALDALAADGEAPAILELGAGTGALAESVLGALGRVAGLRYLILEPSAELAHRQRARLAAALDPEAFARVTWLDGLPEGFAGVILANEVADALPVERFVKTGDGIGECVHVETVEADPPDAASPFEDAFGTAPPALVDALSRVEADLEAPLPAGYASELCLDAAPWMRALAATLRRGVALVIDYGYPRREYYLAERTRGTLACHYRHRMHDDPYLYPGLQDITAHVDFTGLVEAGIEAGLELSGYATQSAFLLGCDLPALAEAARADLERETERIELANAVKTLTLPGEMGERFQVAALSRGLDRPLRGFALQDLSHRL